jgi:hypothetical protein
MTKNCCLADFHVSHAKVNKYRRFLKRQGPRRIHSWFYVFASFVVSLEHFTGLPTTLIETIVDYYFDGPFLHQNQVVRQSCDRFMCRYVVWQHAICRTHGFVYRIKKYNTNTQMCTSEILECETISKTKLIPE